MERGFDGAGYSVIKTTKHHTMSNYNFNTGQQVLISAPQNNFIPSDDTVYHIGSINRVQGVISCQLLLNGTSVGAINQNNLKPFKK